MANNIKTVVITGGSDGIGKEAARQLKNAGHNVIIVGRSKEKTEQAAKELSVPYHIADFSDLSQVKRLAEELKHYEKIDVLANNAGAIFNERTVTGDGIERTFQVNVLGEFLLTALLIEKLCKDKATVIQTSSIASNLFGQGLDLDDLQNVRAYTPTKAYGESKLCNILFTKELHKRYNEKGLSAVAFEPGVTRTNFASEGSAFLRIAYHSPLKYLFTISTERSAKRLTRLALGQPGRDFTSGAVYSYKKPYRVKLKDDGKISYELFKKCDELLQKSLLCDSIFIEK